MSALSLTIGGLLMSVGVALSAEPDFESDAMATSKGDLRITFLGHGTLMFEFDGMVIHVDPVSRYADYSKMPKADVVLVTHEHGDHLDKGAIDKIATEDTVVVLTEACKQRGQAGAVMKNGDVKNVKGLRIEAVPAYNIVHMRRPGQPFHPKGAGNGYVITFGQTRVYVAGDTENVPEMANLAGVDCAFLPMNLPYTMTPEMVADAAKTLKPKILYPYHFGSTDTSKLVELLKDHKDIDVRIRKLQ
jgi:L-ascorbate metabolism protein UlaG (beta-lactamase superfamily)